MVTFKQSNRTCKSDSLVRAELKIESYIKMDIKRCRVKREGATNNLARELASEIPITIAFT